MVQEQVRVRCVNFNPWCDLCYTLTTLAQLQALKEQVDPWDLEAYVMAAQVYRFNGVHQPFWHDWALAEPSKFLTPEPLHHWHKMFWDHDAKWCIRVVGGAEIDFRFLVLHPHTGFHHFKEGISKLKQVTGCEHRDIQHYIIPIIAGAVPKCFLIMVHALTDFHYLSQALEISDKMCIKIQDALAEFHKHKDAIISAGGRTGKKRNIINNWYILKLEFMQSVVPNLRDNGFAMQWSADPTEHAHITEIKHPSKSTNHQEYESQICHYLDHTDKCRRFDLATAVCEASIDFRLIDGGPHDEGELQNASDDENDSLYDPEETEAGAFDTLTSTTTLLLAVSLAGT